MSEVNTPNYPDILGYITGGGRYTVNVVQVALAVRPRVVRAGRAFETILLIQNASNVNVDVTATLQLPEQDAKRQKGKFITRSERLVVGMRPAEVGFVMLPVTCLPDTAVGDSYKIGMEIDVKPLKKPERVRGNEGGGFVAPEILHDDVQTRIEDLKKLNYSTVRRGMRGSVVEAPFNVMTGTVGQLVDLKPEWVSLWTMGDLADDRAMLDRYGEALGRQILPQLKPQAVYPHLFQATKDLLTSGGYDIQPIELHYITKMMATMLEMASPPDESYDYLSDGQYNIALLLRKGWRDKPAFLLPEWARGLLKAIDRDPMAAQRAPELLAQSLYDELLRDTIKHGFAVLKHITGQDLGDDNDIHEYTERLIKLITIDVATPLTFVDVYLPLVLGGVFFCNRAIMPEEQVGDSLRDMLRVLKERQSEVNDDNELVYKMAEQVLDSAMQKYGYR